MNPPEPFYPGTRIGSPVVDLCRTWSERMPYSQVSTHLDLMGMQVDRWSARHYAITPLPEIPAMDVFGTRIPVSIIALSVLPPPGSEPRDPDMHDILEACNYPCIPPDTGTSRNGNTPGTPDRQQQQKFIDKVVSVFSRSLCITFVCTCIISGMLYGASCGLPDWLTGLIEFNLEVLSLENVGCM
jgi:hypothetical protein